MPRDPQVNIPTIHMRPAATTDSLGNATPNGPDVKVTDCVVAVAHVGNRRDPYKSIGGGEMNTQRWTVIVKRAPTIKEGDALHVASGPNAGIYRVEQVSAQPSMKEVIATCLRETTA